MKCPVCDNYPLEHLEVNQAFFRHLDFTTVKPSGVIGRCPACQMLINILQDNEVVKVSHLYTSVEYSQSQQTDQTFMVPEYPRPVSRSFLQAELVGHYLTMDKPMILDIGCFDGALLAEFDRRLPGCELHGYDVNKHCRKFFPRKDNYHFWTAGLEKLPAGFDLVSISHSLTLVHNLMDFFHQIKRLLKPQGLLFIQGPDIAKNPHAILQGDQYQCFTARTMTNLLYHFGFDLIPLEQHWFQRELVVLARPSDGRSSRPRYEEDKSIYACLAYINEQAAKLQNLVNSHRIIVLGTTINAAFVDSVIGPKLAGFTDENPHRLGRQFRGKTVIHPQNLQDTDTVIIPYGAYAEKIKERFVRAYHGNFICM